MGLIPVERSSHRAAGMAYSRAARAMSPPCSGMAAPPRRRGKHRERADPEHDTAAHEPQGAPDVGCGRRVAEPEPRALFEESVIARRAAELHAKRPGAGRHHRTRVGTLPRAGLRPPTGETRARIAAER